MFNHHSQRLMLLGKTSHHNIISTETRFQVSTITSQEITSTLFHVRNITGTCQAHRQTDTHLMASFPGQPG